MTALLAAAVALLPRVETPWSGTVVLGVAMAGVLATYTLVTADMLGRMPSASASTASGIIAGAQSLALIVSGPLIGRALDRYGSYDVIAIALGAWVVPGATIWWFWRPAAHFERST